MREVFFGIDYKAMFIVAVCIPLLYFLWKLHNHYIAPYIAFSSVQGLLHNKGRASWSEMPKALTWLALIAFSLAFIDPHFFIHRKDKESLFGGQDEFPSEGIAIYLILDQSGSMEEKVAVQSLTEGFHLTSKIDLLKQVSKQFIIGDPALGLQGRPNDMIGLIFFARAARVMAPLTLDHEAVLQELTRFKSVGDKDQDGTSIGYAIYKTANMIVATRHYAQELISKGEPAYTIKNSVLILITDGLQDPNPLDKGKRLRNMDVTEAAEYAKENNIKLYIVNVEPKLATDEFMPYRNIMKRAAEHTGGKFFMVGAGSNLEQIYKEIDKLEKSALPDFSSMDKNLRPDLFIRVSMFPYLVVFGLICLLSVTVLDTLILRRVP